MKASDKILTDSKCREAAKKIDPLNYEDLFNECWLNIRERELRDNTWQPDNYQSFFISSLKNFNLNVISRQKTVRKHKDSYKHYININIKNDYSFDEFLIKWVDEKTDDEITNFYKDIIFLVIHNKTIDGIINEVNMGKSSFYKHYETAKQILKHDYLSSTNHNDIFSNYLV